MATTPTNPPPPPGFVEDVEPTKTFRLAKGAKGSSSLPPGWEEVGDEKGDIFDQVAAKGDIFDQIGTPPPARVDRSRPPEGFTESLDDSPTDLANQALRQDKTTAGFRVSPPKPPSVNMEEVDLKTGIPGRRFVTGPAGEPVPLIESKEQLEEFNTEQREGWKFATGAGGYPKIARGLRTLGKGVVNPDAVTPAERYKAGTEILEGGMQAATPLFGMAAITNPLNVAGGIGLGTATGWGAGKVTEVSGGSPEAQEFAKTAGFFLPSAFGVVRGLSESLDTKFPSGLPTERLPRTAAVFRNLIYKAGVEMPENPTPQEADVAFRKAMANVHPDVNPDAGDLGKELSSAYSELKQANYFTAGPRVPQMQTPQLPGIVTPPAPPPETEAAVIEARNQNNEAIGAMMRANATRDLAARMVSGVPLVPPEPELPQQPPPEAPKPGPKGQLRPEVVDLISQKIAQAPPQARGELLLEAHQNLARWLADQGRVIGPDGKIVIIDSPKQADALAAKWVNDSVDAFEKKLAEQPATAVLKPPTALKTVGSKHEPVVEESRATIDAQLTALQRGMINVVHIPAGSDYQPEVPAGMQMIKIQRQFPGAGTYYYNPKDIAGAQIRRAAKAGTHGKLLGHLQTKQELRSAPSTVVVTARNKAGVPVQDSEVDASRPDVVHKQAEVLSERHPGTKIELATPEKVITERLQSKQQEQAAPPDGFTEDPNVEPVYSKGDRVVFVDRDGVEREGVLRHVNQLAARVESEGLKYEIAPSSIRGAVRELSARTEAPRSPALQLPERGGKTEYKYEPIKGETVPGEKVFYHGVRAGGALRSISDADPVSHDSGQNLFGPGLYLSDNPNVASSYAGVARAKYASDARGHVLSTKLRGAKLFNTEEAAPPAALAILNKQIEYYGGEPLPDGTTGAKALEALREALAGSMVTLSDADDALEEVQHQLHDKLGYVGNIYKGGARTGNELHNVVQLYPDYLKAKGTIYPLDSPALPHVLFGDDLSIGLTEAQAEDLILKLRDGLLKADAQKLAREILEGNTLEAKSEHGKRTEVAGAEAHAQHRADTGSPARGRPEGPARKGQEDLARVQGGTEAVGQPHSGTPEEVKQTYSQLAAATISSPESTSSPALDTSKPTVLLARHGTTRLNKESGQSAETTRGWLDVPLTTEGVESAEKLGRDLAHFPIDVIWNADLGRSQQTADIIAKHFPNAERQTRHDLRPVNLGDLAGKEVKLIADQLKHYIDHPDEVIPNGESYNSFYQRAAGIFREAQELANSGKLVLVIAFSRHMHAAPSLLSGGEMAIPIKGGPEPGSAVAMQDLGNGWELPQLGKAEKPVEQAKPKTGRELLRERARKYAPKPATAAPGEVGPMPVADIQQAPSVFQYKSNTDAEGVGTLLKETTVFNKRAAGTIMVWTTPANESTPGLRPNTIYVVNGHHRLELAKRTGETSINVFHDDAPDAMTARADGAIMNIAEGRGTSVDAAKFFRDTGYTPEDMKRIGLSMGESRVKGGLSLAALDDVLFSKVASGEMNVGRGIAIAEASKDHAEQRAIADLVDTAEARGKRVTDAMIEELVRFVKGTGKTEESTQSLFGEQHVERSLAVEKAEVSAYIKQQLAKDKRFFGVVSKTENAGRLERAEAGHVETDRARDISTAAAQAEEVYTKLSERTGSVASVLNQAAQRLAQGENPHAVKQEAYTAVRAELSQALGGGAGAHHQDAGAAEKGGGTPAETAETQGQLDKAGSGAAIANLPLHDAIDAVPSVLRDNLRELQERIKQLDNERTTAIRERKLARSRKLEAERRRLADMAQNYEKAIGILQSPDTYSSPWRPNKDAVRKYADQMSFSLVSGEDGAPPVIRMNPAAKLVLDWLLGRGQAVGIGAGVQISPPQASRAVMELSALSGELTGLGRDLAAQNLDRFGSTVLAAMAQRPTGGVAFAVERPWDTESQRKTENEERTHVVQTEVGGGDVLKHVDGEALFARSEMQKALPYLEQAGYPYKDVLADHLGDVRGAKTAMVTELFAKINRDDRRKFGLTADEAARWVQAYLQALTPALGVDVAAKLGPVAGSITRKFLKEAIHGRDRGTEQRTGGQERGGVSAGVPVEQGPDGAAPGNQGGAAAPRAGERPPTTGDTILEDRSAASESELTASSRGAIKEFYERDLKPWLERSGIGAGLSDIARLFVEGLYPRIEESSIIGRALKVAAPRDAVDVLMELKAERERSLSEFDMAMSAIEAMFDRMPQSARIDFIDRIMQGKKQPSPELQRIQQALLDTLKEQREQEKIWRRFNDRPNYFPLRWEIAPGSGERGRVSGMTRGSLEGSKTFAKAKAIPDASTGIALGGKLQTTNPVRLMRMRLGEGLQFTTARSMWRDLQELGLRKFLRPDEPTPQGWEDLDDRLAQVYFPAESGEGLVKGGRWAVEAGSARLLRNFLSRDLIREFAVGRGLVALKNASTALELALSPFHFVFEGIESISNAASVGMLHLYNRGIREADAEAAAKGLGQILAAPLAPIAMAREGGALVAYAESRSRIDAIAKDPDKRGVFDALRDFRELRKEKAVAKLLKRYPDLDHLLDDAFTGGLILGQHHDYQLQTLRTIREEWTGGNVFGAAMRSIPAGFQTLQRPLFQVYIPNLKLSYFLRQFTEQLAEHAAEIESGKITRAELARRVVDSTDNRFGEMNFDNLFWNRTLKTSLQLLFRSVTWKLGNWREFIGAIAGQSKELGEWARLLPQYDPARAETPFFEQVREGSGEQSSGGHALPRLDMKFSWLLSLLWTTAALGTIAGKVFSGRWPWEWAQDEEADDSGKLSAYYREVAHPRTGDYDYRGKPVRLSLPTYIREGEGAYRSPGSYIHNSLSSMFSRALDIGENRDYADNYVFNPNARFLGRQKQKAEYAFPTPFIISNYERASAEGDPRTALLSAFGFTRAPRDLDFTKAESMMSDMLRARKTPFTPEQLQEFADRRKAVEDGTASPEEMRKELERARTPWAVQMYKRLTYKEARDVFEVASVDERPLFRPILESKRRNALHLRPLREGP